MRKSRDFFVYSMFVLGLGSIYTLARKYQNLQQSTGPDGVLSYFHQPMYLNYQVFWLFLGMSCCLPAKRFLDTCLAKELETPNKLAVIVKRKYSPTLIIFPSFCDVFATILDTTGLIYTHVSVHQMLKGFIVVFTFIISILVFKRQYKSYHYLSILLIFLGCIQVGRSNIESFEKISAPNPALGNFLCVLGQLLLSFMFIYEEYILKDFDIHILEMVGWEGIWGTSLSFLILTFTYYFPHAIIGCSDNFFYASCQIFNNPKLLLAVLVSSSVIGPFNYFGSGLTRIASASHRSTIDSMRMCVVWLVCVLGGFEDFRMQQMYGYFLMCLGSIIYNETFTCEPLKTKTSLFSMQLAKKIRPFFFLLTRKREDPDPGTDSNTLKYVHLDLTFPTDGTPGASEVVFEPSDTV